MDGKPGHYQVMPMIVKGIVARYIDLSNSRRSHAPKRLACFAFPPGIVPETPCTQMTITEARFDALK